MLSLLDIDRPCMRRVKLRNYKSIGHCHVELGRLTFLVGRNGAGKSNFLDALHFVLDGLQSSLDHAIRARGGMENVRRFSTGHPRNFSIELEIGFPDRSLATYGFEIASAKEASFEVKQERLRIVDPKYSVIASFRRERGEVTEPESPERPLPPVLKDRLYLVNAAGLPEYRNVYDALISMGFYNLHPQAMRELQNPDVGELLHGDGRNIASVVHRLSEQEPGSVDRIRQYLGKIVPDITRFERHALGPRETLLFYQRIKGAEHPWKFYASSMSDGTLRALGALVAVSQLSATDQRVLLVGIEEPETALHPAVASALMDALREATRHTQVVVTSHSPDLLDEVDVEQDVLLVVASREGTTEIAPADPASSEALRQHLYSAGELLKMDQLQPDPENVEQQEQVDLFAAVTAS